MSPCATSRSGRGVTCTSFTKPPMLFTSVTPGTVRSCGLITQSWSVRRSVGSQGRPCSSVAPGSRLDGEHEDLAEARRDRPERGLEALGQPRHRLAQALVHELAREVDVGAVLEDDRHLREPVARERSACTRAAAGPPIAVSIGNVMRCSDFERRVARRLGVDLHLDVRDVRHRVDRQRREAVGADAGGDERRRREPASGARAPCERWLRASAAS